MFDSVGRNLDEDANKRSAKAAFLIAILVGTTAAGVVLAGLWTVREIVLEQLDQEPVAVLMEEPMAEEELLPPPPPPPPPSSGPEEEEDDEDAEEEPDELDEVQELEEKIVEEPVKSADKPKGVEGGVEGGQEGGVVGGVLGGVEGGVLGGSLAGGGPKVVHHSQVEVKRRIEPTYPMAARGMGLGEQRCIVQVEIDETGVPAKVSVDKCPKVFHAGTEEAMLKWRWYPYKIEGEKLRVSTKIAVVYRENG